MDEDGDEEMADAKSGESKKDFSPVRSGCCFWLSHCNCVCIRAACMRLTASAFQIPQDLLRKYIQHARETCHPKLSRIDDDKLGKLYAELRRESQHTGAAPRSWHALICLLVLAGGIPIAPRHMESMIRMSEAHAKMHLREFVNEEDVNMGEFDVLPVTVLTLLEQRFVSCWRALLARRSSPSSHL